jgi:hypothetical protein
MAHLDVYPMPGGARRGYVVDATNKDVDGGTKPRHDEEVRPVPNSIYLFPSKRDHFPSKRDQRETVLRALDLLLTGV